MGEKSHNCKKLWQVPIFVVVMTLKLLPLFIDEVAKVFEHSEKSRTEYHEDKHYDTDQHDASDEKHDEHHKEDPETEEEELGLDYQPDTILMEDTLSQARRSNNQVNLLDFHSVV